MGRLCSPHHPQAGRLHGLAEQIHPTVVTVPTTRAGVAIRSCREIAADAHRCRRRFPILPDPGRLRAVLSPASSRRDRIVTVRPRNRPADGCVRCARATEILPHHPIYSLRSSGPPRFVGTITSVRPSRGNFRPAGKVVARIGPSCCHSGRLLPPSIRTTTVCTNGYSGAGNPYPRHASRHPCDIPSVALYAPLAALARPINLAIRPATVTSSPTTSAVLPQVTVQNRVRLADVATKALLGLIRKMTSSSQTASPSGACSRPHRTAEPSFPEAMRLVDRVARLTVAHPLRPGGMEWRPRGITRRGSVALSW